MHGKSEFSTGSLKEYSTISDYSQLTPEKVLAFQQVNDAQISPDGNRTAYVISDSFKQKRPWAHSAIWMIDNAHGTPQQITTGTATDSLPRWSPDGTQLAFLSDRIQQGQRQLFRLSITGGEAFPLTNVKGSIPCPRGLNSIQWSPDGMKLAFLMEAPDPKNQRRGTPIRSDVIEFEKTPRFVQLWTVDLSTQEVQCVSPPGLQIWEFCWHPDGNQFAVVASDLPWEWSWYSNYLALLTSEGEHQVIRQSRRQHAFPTFSPDGQNLAFLSSNWSDRGCTAGNVWMITPSSQHETPLSEGITASFSCLDWDRGSHSLLALGHESGGTGIYRLSVQEQKPISLWWDQASVSESFSPRLSRSTNGRLALVREDSRNPRDVWVGQEKEHQITWSQTTTIHPQANSTPLGETFVHKWTGSDGLELQGLVIRPVNYQPHQSYPLVTWVHGGPTGISSDRYYAATGWNQLLASAGYAVFLPNYRGSVGWGLEFAESNIGDMGGEDFQDILRGIESLEQSGLADSNQLAIAGWSYGGFMAAWAVSQTSQFRAAIMGAGISHWLSFHGKSCLSDWDAIHYDASPYDSNGPFTRFSPLTYSENLSTPTLILHGEKDQDVPVEQSHLFYRALKDKGVDVELAVYPREAHAITEYEHQLDMAYRVLGWLAKYLPCPND